MTESRDEAAVGAVLQRRAADVRPSPHAWEAITARLDEQHEATVLTFDRDRTGGRRRAVGAAAAAAVAAATLGGAALLGSGSTWLVADAPEAGPVTTVAPAPAPAPATTPIPAVWPETTAEALRSAAERQRSLLDPRGTAELYLVDRLAPDGLELGDLQQGDAQSGSLRYTTADGLSGEVLLRRLGGEGTPWYVVATVNDLLVLFPEVVEGRVELAVTAEAAGTITYEVVDPGEDVLATGEVVADARETVVLATLDHEGPLVTRARLTADGRLISFLEVRTELMRTETVPGPRTSTPTTTPVVEDVAAIGETNVVLEADGLGFVGAGDDTPISHLPFGSDQGDVLAALGASLGEPVEVGTNDDCPPGPAEVASFPDGFVATFQDGAFVGWTVRGRAQRTAAGIGVGSTVAEVRAAQPGIAVEETTLGWELVGGDVYGVVSGPSSEAVVEILLGGANCVFR